MSNPLLNERYFQGAGAGGAVIDATASDTGAGMRPPDAAAYGSGTRPGTMTMGGVASAAGVMLLFVLAGGWFGWSKVVATSTVDIAGRTVDTTQFPTGWMFGSVIIGLVLAVICSFKPPLARILAIPYALAEGVFLGVISHTYDIRTQGVALQAVIATGAVFLVMLALYGFRVLRVTPRMTKAIIAATFGVMAIYIVGWIASLFTDSGLRFMDSTSGLSILVSVVVVGIASFNLLLDFDFIERGVKAGLPKEMEWFGAFGLVVTLVWLYLELLRLLSKLQRR
jgi:uncharacterized YccA/Bax inhibitor family protein